MHFEPFILYCFSSLFFQLCVVLQLHFNRSVVGSGDGDYKSESSWNGSYRETENLTELSGLYNVFSQVYIVFI